MTSVSNAKLIGPVRILIAGGCHVVGFPKGEGKSLTGLLEAQLKARGLSVEILGLPYVKLTHAKKVMTLCADFNPDVLVLQIGHFELSQTLSAYLRGILDGQESGNKGSGSSELTGEVGYAGLFYMRAALKLCIDWCLRHPLVDFTLFREQLRQFLSAMADRPLPLTVLLSPLPCADPLFMAYRRRAGSILKRAAKDHHSVFLDLLPTLPPGRQRRFGLDELSYNGSHLGREGLRAVSKPLVEYLAAVLKDLSKEAKEAVV
jgi:hypothetical protein